MNDANWVRPGVPLSLEAANVLRKVGWSPAHDRSGEVADWIRALECEFSPFPRALEVLARFGGVYVKLSAPGEAWARQSLDRGRDRNHGKRTS
jgi:hypothetical protein